MARFLFASVPLIGHVNPAVPIAKELIMRGHEVGWYAGRRFRGQIEGLGARFFPRKTARDFDAVHVEEAFPEKRRLSGLASLKFDVKHLFLDSIPGHRLDLIDILGRFPADALVSDSAFFGIETLRQDLKCGWAAYGISCLCYQSADTAPFGPGLLPGGQTFGRARNRVLNYFAEYVVGRDVVKHYDRIRSSLGLGPSHDYVTNVIVNTVDLYIQPSIASFEYPRGDLPRTVHFIGAFSPKPSAAFTPPPWWNELQTDSPVVHVTQGTLSTDFRDLLIPTLRALDKEDCLVIATTGGKPAESIGLTPWPQNARLASYVPHHRLLPWVDVMVTNGGYGGVQQALAHGVPLVAAGHTEEKPEVCARIRWSGAGIDLRTGKPAPACIRRAVKKVLETPRFKMNAQRLQAEYRRYDPPRLAADLLERLAATKRPILRPETH